MATNRRKLLLALAASLALLALPASMAGAQSWSVETTATTTEGSASVTVRVFGDSGELKGAFGGAGVYVNRSYVGHAPWSVGSMAPGTYLIGADADGYYPQEASITLREKTSYTVTFVLQRRTGFLSTFVSPADAEVLVDGKSSRSGIVELPTGSHNVLVRRFAYAEQAFTVRIAERATTFLDVRLSLAPFAVGGLEVSRPAFDPRNSGVLGGTSLSFSVTSYGSGTMEVLSPDGAVVASFDLPLFEDWQQGVEWKGRDASGAVLPDGSYRVRLRAHPVQPSGLPGVADGQAPAESAEETVREAEVRIDSSLALSPLGASGAVAGLLCYPEAGRLLPGISVAGFGLYTGEATFAGEAGAGLEASFVHSFGGVSIGASAAMDDIGSEDWSAAISVGTPLAPESGSGPLVAGALFRASYDSATASGEPWNSATAGGFGLELSLPTAATLGSFRAGLAPGLRLTIPAGGAADAGIAPMVNAGFWYAGRTLRAGISCRALAASFAAPLDLALPLRLAGELALALDSTPLVLRTAVLAELSPGSGADWGLYLGLDFLF
jgi:hypothetical protein